MSIPLRRIAAGLPVKDSAAVIVKTAALADARAARSLIEDAQREAQRLLDDARARADEELRLHRAELEKRMWQRTADYAAGIGREWEQALDQVERSMAAVLGRALVRLVESVPPEERLRACVRQLIGQAGAPDTGVLMVSAEDEPAIVAVAASLPWPVQRGADLPQGTVRLVSAQGRWECGVDSAMQHLLEAMGVSARELSEEQDDFC